ncbi:hypothetical protein Tco_0973305 [Tanacetum coccineum]
MGMTMEEEMVMEMVMEMVLEMETIETTTVTVMRTVNKKRKEAIGLVPEMYLPRFQECQPLSFKGTEGVVGLIRWSEKIETVFHISNFPERYQVKYATSTLLDSALTWWNSHKRTIGTDVCIRFVSMRELLKLITGSVTYCNPLPENRSQKMETELWNLSVKNNDMATYTQRFQEPYS